eukprot:jgi/Picsp_1/4960/NSC_02323-R1_---NA---
MKKCPTKTSEIPYPSEVKEIYVPSEGKSCYCPSGLRMKSSNHGEYYAGVGSNCLPTAYDSSYCDKIPYTPVSQSCPKAEIDETCPTFTGRPILEMSELDQSIAKRFKEVSQSENPFKSLRCSSPVDRRVMAIFASIQENYISTIPKKTLQEFGGGTEFAPLRYAKMIKILSQGDAREELLKLSRVKSLLNLWGQMTDAVGLLEFSFKSAKLVEAARLGKDSKIIKSLTKTLITKDIPNVLNASGKMKVGKKILEYWGYKLSGKGLGFFLKGMVEMLDQCLRTYGSI